MPNMADDTDVAIAWYFLRNEDTNSYRRKKPERRFGVDDVISRRVELGEYQKFVEELRTMTEPINAVVAPCGSCFNNG